MPNTDIDTVLYKFLCREWIIKYCVVDRSICAASKGHNKDKIVFFSNNEVSYNCAGQELHGTWIYNNKDSSLNIYEGDEVVLESRLIIISDSLLAFETTDSKGETVGFYWIPDNEANRKLTSNSCQFYIKKEIDLGTIKVKIEFPFEPRYVEDKSDPSYSIYRYEYAYPDFSYENYLYGIMITCISNSLNAFDNLANQVLKLKAKHSEDKLLSEKSIMIQNHDAKELKFKVLIADANLEMIITTILFSYKGIFIQLYVYSPTTDISSPDNIKTRNSIDNFFESIKIE